MPAKPIAATDVADIDAARRKVAAYLAAHGNQLPVDAVSDADDP